MRINEISNAQSGNNRVNFKAAMINIAALSDPHGKFVDVPRIESALTVNKNDIFTKSDPGNSDRIVDSASVVNLYINAGDFGINQGGGIYKSNAKMKHGDYQLYFTEMLARIARKTAKDVVGQKSPCLSIRTMGNHDYDNGDEYLFDKLKSSEFINLFTNANMAKSPLLSSYMQKYPDRFVRSRVLSIPDDKHLDDRNFDRKVLLLGVTIPTLDFYAPGMLKGTEYLDNSNKKDAKLTKKDLSGTIDSVKTRVEDFKNENPKGVVILLSHTGNKISSWIAEDVKDINLVLNGHDHKREVTHIGKTAIHSLASDNKLLKSFNLFIDDDGNLVRVRETSYDTAVYDSRTHRDKTITQKLIENLLNKDAVPSSDVVQYLPLRNERGDRIYKTLPYDETNIRSANDPLANLISSYCASAARNKVDRDIATLAIQSSAIRGGFREDMTNIDLMNVFNGVGEDLAGISVGTMSGRELVGVIVENVFDNLDAPKRNTLLQWSDTKINKDLIARFRDKDQVGKYDVNLKKYANAVHMRNLATQEFEPIQLDKMYKVALPYKFLIKTDLKYPIELSKDNRFVPTGYTTEGLFRSKLQSKEGTIKLSDKTLETRVVWTQKAAKADSVLDESFISVPFFDNN